MRTEFIRGVGRREEGFVIILDVDRVFSGEELALAQSAAPATESGIP